SKTAIFARDDSGSLILFSGFDDDKALIAGLVFGFLLTLATHGTDQDIAQRMLTCRSSLGGKLSIAASAALIVPLFVLFLAIGTLLWFFHETSPGAWAPPSSELMNEVFPLYVARGLPAGVSGLVVAGLLAAALSSFTSALNALASAAIGDFWRPLVRDRSERYYLRAGKIATLVLAALLLLTALSFIGTGKNIFKLSLHVFTYFHSALLGAFLLGLLTRRGRDGTVLAGMMVSVPLMLTLQLREFIIKPTDAPDAVNALIAHLPAGAIDLLKALPHIAPGWWLLLGTTVCAGIGALSSRSPRGFADEASDAALDAKKSYRDAG